MPDCAEVMQPSPSGGHRSCVGGYLCAWLLSVMLVLGRLCCCAQVIGVEPSGANAMAMSLEQGRRVTLSRVDAFADGVAVKHVS